MKYLYCSTIIVISSFLITTAVTAGPEVTINKQAIADVMSGKTRVAHAAWWGFHPVDSTKALQSAINSGAAKVIVDNRESPWIVNQIQLASDQEIVFEKGVTVLAKKGEFKAATASLFSASLKKNIKLTGEGAILKMHRADYTQPPYKKAEWRNGISLRSCSNVSLSGLIIQETGGDGIYLGVAKRGVTNKNITIKNVICDRNYRQGISVISAEDLLIQDCEFKGTAGTAPMAGIDFEPNQSDERLVNCVLRNCVSQNNQGPGYLLYLPHLNRNSKPVSIRFENCRSTGENRGLSCTTRNNSPGSVLGSIEFENCTFKSTRQSPVAFLDKPADVCPVLLKQCTIIGPDKKANTMPAIHFTARAGVIGTIGGVKFEDCIIRSPAAQPVMSFDDQSYVAAVDNITGTLRVEHGDHKIDYRLNKKLINRWMPASKAGNIAPYKTDLTRLVPLDASMTRHSAPRRIVRQRALSRFLLYADKGETVTTRLTYHQLVRYTGNKMPVTVVTPSGKILPVVDVPFKMSAECKFVAPETGTYRISCDPGANFVTVDASSHRICLTSKAGPIRLMASTGEFFFWVPAGVEKWAVGVFGGGPGETVSATLYDPSGKKVWRVQNVDKPELYTANNTDRTQGELWKLVLDRPTQGGFEDHYVQLIGVPSLLSLTPSEILIPTENK